MKQEMNTVKTVPGEVMSDNCHSNSQAIMNTCLRTVSIRLIGATPFWALFLCLSMHKANAFWFICSYRDAAKAAEVANKAKERYNEYLSDGRATPAQVAACKQAWDVLRTNTFAAIAKFAQEVPGTSLTGPPNVKDLTKDAIKEAIKEVLGEVAVLHREGMPLPLYDGQSGEFTRPSGVMVALLANRSVPVENLVDENITSLSLTHVSARDYDGSLGEAPPWSLESGPLLLIQGSFSGVAIGNIAIGAQNPVAAAHAGAAFTPADLRAALLERPTLFQGAFDSGFFSPGLLQWTTDQQFEWDRKKKVNLAMHQIGSLWITSVDAGSGTVSGNFFAIAGPGPIWDNGAFDQQITTASEVDTGGDEARAADDFELDHGNGLLWTVKLITAQLVQNFDPLANLARLEIYADSGAGSPTNGPPLAILQGIDSQTVGTNFSGDQVQEFVFEPNGLKLPPGRYWLAAMGLGNGSRFARASFASANHPFIRLRQGHVLRPSEGAVEWTPVDLVDGIATDFAFTVDAEQPALVSAIKASISRLGPPLAKLSWPAVGSSHNVLEQAISAVGPWLQLGQPVLNDRGERHVIVSVPAENRFFRLRTQSLKGFCEGSYDCVTSGATHMTGERTTIGFWGVATCPGSTTLGDGSVWNLRPLTCVCP